MTFTTTFRSVGVTPPSQVGARLDLSRLSEGASLLYGTRSEIIGQADHLGCGLFNPGVRERVQDRQRLDLKIMRFHRGAAAGEILRLFREYGCEIHTITGRSAGGHDPGQQFQSARRHARIETRFGRDPRGEPAAPGPRRRAG